MDDYFPLHKESGLGANIDKNLTSVVALRTNVLYMCYRGSPLVIRVILPGHEYINNYLVH